MTHFAIVLMDFSTTKTITCVINFITAFMENPMSFLAQHLSFLTKLKELASDRNKLLLMPKSVKSKRNQVKNDMKGSI